MDRKTKALFREIMREIGRKGGKIGGKRSLETMTPEQR
jgi:general stress protein YciG